MAIIKVCDVCGSKNCSEISFCIGDQMSPAGDRDYSFEKYDLCSECFAQIFMSYLKNKDYIEIEVFSKIIKKAINHRKGR